jgi:hypothetical protein
MGARGQAAAMLGPRALNRATLHRQMLLRREDLPAVSAVERLVGLNAQDPNLPYVALWSRLQRFSVAELTAAIEDRSLVRSTMMRATQHVVPVSDFRLIRPVLAPLLRRVQRNAFGRRTAGIDLDGLVADARELLAGGRVLTRGELGRLLARRRPGADPTALGWTVQYLEALVHPAPSGTWNTRGPTPFALADWTGVRRPAVAEDACHMVRRYLAAFGPATVADARAWSGASGLREVFDRLRPELRTYRDEAGRELFDLPDAPRPVADTPAPVRFLPEFDAAVLAHADRTRIMTDDARRQVCDGAAVAATVLVDGTVAATWSLSSSPSSSPPGSRRADAVTLTVRPLRALSRAEGAAVEAEANRLLAFVRPDASRPTVRLSPPSGAG